MEAVVVVVLVLVMFVEAVTRADLGRGRRDGGAVRDVVLEVEAIGIGSRAEAGRLWAQRGGSRSWVRAVERAGGGADRRRERGGGVARVSAGTSGAKVTPLGSMGLRWSNSIVTKIAIAWKLMARVMYWVPLACQSFFYSRNSPLGSPQQSGCTRQIAHMGQGRIELLMNKRIYVFGRSCR